MRTIIPIRRVIAMALVAMPFAAGFVSPTSSHKRCQKISRVEVKGGIAEVWDSYNALLESSPLVTKSLTASVILGSADCAGQFIEKVTASRQGEKEKELDLARVFRFFIFGLVLQAPWNHYYYLVLDGAIPPTAEPFSQSNIIKIIIDQFVQAPIFTVLIFVFLGALEGKTIEEIQQKLKDDYPETIVNNWKLFIPATAINIGFVPPILRVLYLNVVFFFWCIYLSLVLNKEEKD